MMFSYFSINKKKSKVFVSSLLAMTDQMERTFARHFLRPPVFFVLSVMFHLKGRKGQRRIFVLF